MSVEEEESLGVSGSASLRRTVPITTKKNEINFCLSPSDPSLSSPSSLSITRSLNSAVNGGLRRIMLSRSWPTKEAMEVLLRKEGSGKKEKVRREKEKEKQKQKEKESVFPPLCHDRPSNRPILLTSQIRLLLLIFAHSQKSSSKQAKKVPKCPVPRPILNVLTKNYKKKTDRVGMDKVAMESVEKQLELFRRMHPEDSDGFKEAVTFLECVLSLSVDGVESPRLADLRAANIFTDSYSKMVQVLESAGAEFVPPREGEEGQGKPCKPQYGQGWPVLTGVGLTLTPPRPLL